MWQRVASAPLSHEVTLRLQLQKEFVKTWHLLVNSEPSAMLEVLLAIMSKTHNPDNDIQPPIKSTAKTKSAAIAVVSLYYKQ